MKISILYPRERNVGMQSISVHWLKRMFPFAKTFFLDSHLAGLKDSDVILISCHYENNFPYILNMLEKAGIPILRKERKQKIYLGGPIAVNPYPLYYFINAFFIGDFDSSVKEGILDENLSKYEYVFLPEEKESVRISRKCEEIHYGFYENKLYIQVQQGCRSRCRFCLIGWTKTQKMSEIEDMKKLVKMNKINSVFLVGSDIFSHPEIVEFISFLKEKNVKVSFPSMRVDEIEKYIDVIKNLRLENFTIAPESSERLRKLLGKNFSDEEIIECAEILKNHGTKKLKLYFIIGLPYERDEDIFSCISLLNRLKQLKLRISATFSIFVPKPHTPFQFARFESVEALSRKNKILRKELRFIKLHLANPKKAFIQFLLSIGDKKIAELLRHVYPYGLNYSVWTKTAKSLDINLDSYSVEKHLEYSFPFEGIETGVSKKTLYSVYENYKKNLF